MNQINSLGNKEGLWIQFYPTKIVAAIGTYKNGKEVGKWKHFDLNGYFWCAGYFENGWQVKVWEYYCKSGKLEDKIFFL